jgi:hypothetical protein
MVMQMLKELDYLINQPEAMDGKIEMKVKGHGSNFKIYLNEK